MKKTHLFWIVVITLGTLPLWGMVAVALIATHSTALMDFMRSSFLILAQLGIVFIGIIAAPIALLRMIFKEGRREAFGVFAVAVLSVVSVLCSEWVVDKIRVNALHRLMAQSDPLIKAIGAYESAHGQPPAPLDTLVPEYIGALPETGMSLYPKYYYHTVDDMGENKWVLVLPSHGLIPFGEKFIYHPNHQYPGPESGDTYTPVGDWARMVS